jgi:nucleotide-binding universal stress UspA family protein
MPIEKILVPIDFTPCSRRALDYALAMADECGAEVEVVYVWRPQGIFAETPEGVAMEELLTAAEYDHAARVCGRLEFGDEPARIILAILEHEPFDLVVIGEDEEDGHGHVVADVKTTARCAVIAMPAKAA